MRNIVATFELDENSAKKNNFDLETIFSKLESKGVYLEDFEEIDLEDDQRVLIGIDGGIELL